LIPAKALDRYQGQTLKVELVTYADGGLMEVGHIYSLAITKIKPDTSRSKE
jgi:hypothetical protein